MRLLIASLLCLTVVAADARASDVDPVERGLQLARESWPGSPCAGHETVEFVTATPPGWDAGLGWAPVGPDCRIVVLAGQPAWRLCVTIVHEAGHLAGLSHDPEPGRVMSGDGTSEYPPCGRDPSYAASEVPLIAEEMFAHRVPEGRIVDCWSATPTLAFCRAPRRGWPLICASARRVGYDTVSFKRRPCPTRGRVRSVPQRTGAR